MAAGPDGGGCVLLCITVLVVERGGGGAGWRRGCPGRGQDGDVFFYCYA